MSWSLFAPRALGRRIGARSYPKDPFFVDHLPNLLVPFQGDTPTQQTRKFSEVFSLFQNKTRLNVLDVTTVCEWGS